MIEKPAWANEHERQKYLKFGKRGYEHCAYSLKRLINLTEAIFDESLDCFFENHTARLAYFKEDSSTKRIR